MVVMPQDKTGHTGCCHEGTRVAVMRAVRVRGHNLSRLASPPKGTAPKSKIPKCI